MARGESAIVIDAILREHLSCFELNAKADSEEIPIRLAVAGSSRILYRTIMKLSCDPVAAIRVAIAGNPLTETGLLIQMQSDEVFEVRAAASNQLKDRQEE
jgi:hypothetical protein